MSTGRKWHAAIKVSVGYLKWLFSVSLRAVVFPKEPVHKCHSIRSVNPHAAHGTVGWQK